MMDVGMSNSKNWCSYKNDYFGTSRDHCTKRKLIFICNNYTADFSIIKGPLSEFYGFGKADNLEAKYRLSCCRSVRMVCLLSTTRKIGFHTSMRPLRTPKRVVINLDNGAVQKKITYSCTSDRGWIPSHEMVVSSFRFEWVTDGRRCLPCLYRYFTR